MAVISLWSKQKRELVVYTDYRSGDMVFIKVEAAVHETYCSSKKEIR
jgi:ribosomal protein L21E